MAVVSPDLGVSMADMVAATSGQPDLYAPSFLVDSSSRVPLEPQPILPPLEFETPAQPNTPSLTGRRTPAA